MTLESKNKLIKWAYLPERIIREGRVPQTNVCKLFWRTVFMVPLFIFFLIILATATAWIWLPIVLVVKVKRVGDFYDRLVNRMVEKKKSSVIFAYLKSLKDKTCVTVNMID